MQMENNEKIVEFFNRIITHTNAMKNYGEKISDQSIIEKSRRNSCKEMTKHICFKIKE